MKISNMKMLPISNANSNLGLALATLATLATFAASALPLVWRADWPDAKPVETLVHRGTDVELQPQWRINKEPADTNGWTYTTFCQTNAVGPWFGPLPGAFFSHTNDVGAAFYNVMVRAETPGGAVNYTAFARFRMLDSPGFAPGELPLPAQSIDFADVEIANAPWPDEIAAATNAIPGTVSNIVTKSYVEALGISGGGTTDYNNLENKPSINSVTLSGNKTAADLGLATAAQGAKADTAYQKPQAGIPASDMTQEVQTSLGKANTALQADSPGLLYAMGAVVDVSEITPSTDPETGLEYIAVSLSNRTINRIKVGNGDTSDLRLALPPAENGRSRDFYVSLRGFIASRLAPLAVSVTGATLHDVAGGAFAIELPLSPGDYERTYHLTEIDAATTAPNSDPVFLVAIDIPRALYDNSPKMAGAASAGSSENASRGDHVHPAETAGSARYAEVGEMGAFVADDFFPVRATIPGIAVTEFTAANTEFLIEYGATEAFVLTYEHDGVFLSIAKFDYVTGAYISPGADVSGVPTFNGITPTPGGFPMVLKSARNAEPVAVRGVKVAPLASPAFTGTPTAPTPAAADNSTKVATTAFVKTAISGISVTPLSGQTFNFATTQGVMDALKATIEALGGTVTNAPPTPAQNNQTQGE